MSHLRNINRPLRLTWLVTGGQSEEAVLTPWPLRSPPIDRNAQETRG